MKLIYSLFALILATFGGFGAQVSGPVPYSRMTTNDFRIDAQGFVWLRLSPSITISNNVILVTTNMFVTNATIFINGTNVAVINPTDNYHAKRGGPTNLVDSTISDDGTTTTIHGTGQSVLQLETDDGQVVFGSGGTNKVYRTNGVDLEYWNPSYGLTLQPSFRVREGDGKYVGLGFDQIGGGLTLGSAATLTIGQNYLVTHNVFPYGAGYHVGTVNNSSQKYQYLAALTNYVVGFDDGAGNHSWLATSHGGTNDAIHFDSQSAGTAGPPRPMYWDIGSTNYAQLYATGVGISTLPILRLNDDSGAFINLSTGLPYPVLTGSTGLELIGGFYGVEIESSTNALHPITTAVMDLGTQGYTWNNLSMRGTNFIYGYNEVDGSSAMAIYHGGTNDAIHLDSQSSGAAGSPRPIRLELGSTNIVTVGDGSITLARGMTKAVKATLTPAEGMIVFQSDNTPGLRVYQNGAWAMISTVADP